MTLVQKGEAKEGPGMLWVGLNLPEWAFLNSFVDLGRGSMAGVLLFGLTVFSFTFYIVVLFSFALRTLNRRFKRLKG